MRLIAVALCVLVAAGCARTGYSTLPAGQSAAASIFPFGSSGYKTIFSFQFNSTTSGDFPSGALTNVNGMLYGTTQGGGAHLDGTVFKMTPSGAQKVIYSFKAGSDGANPEYGSLVDLNGVLYGTTSRGGSGDYGTVFKVTTGGVEKVLHAFKAGKDGEAPNGGLTDVGGVLYGTTSYGGSDDDGTIFKITTGGAEKVLHAFTAQSNNGVDGALPEGTLTDVNGTLYGTTKTGGNDSNDGTVFTISTSGKEKVIHAFSGHDGEYPYGGVTYVNRALYGTTCGGGVSTSSQGTVFKMTTSGHEDWLYSFKGAPDGACPGYGNLIYVGNSLFGTTTKGGTTAGGSGAGTVYKITTSGAEKVLHIFGAQSADDGSLPESGLTSLGKLLYGATFEGGGNGYDGTAYQIRP
jgi:uncharacterized repeat protein (TIGR03803 family)